MIVAVVMEKDFEKKKKGEKTALVQCARLDSYKHLTIDVTGCVTV